MTRTRMNIGLWSASLDLARMEEGTAKSVVPRFILIRKSIIPIPRVGGARRKRTRDREEERKWRPGGKSDTKSKETPSQSAAPPLYHWVLTSARCHPRAYKLTLRIGIIITSFFRILYNRLIFFLKRH